MFSFSTLALWQFPLPLLHKWQKDGNRITPKIWGFTWPEGTSVFAVAQAQVKDPGFRGCDKYTMVTRGSHSIKFQSIVLPKCFIANLAGLYESKRHDSTMLRESGLLASLRQVAFHNNQPLCLYGDPAYPCTAWGFICKHHLEIGRDEEWGSSTKLWVLWESQ